MQEMQFDFWLLAGLIARYLMPSAWPLLRI